MYVCSCFGITEEQVKQHADAGRCTPRQIASACKAGTDCGSCVRRIQALLGRGESWAGRTVPAAGSSAPEPVSRPAALPAVSPAPAAVPAAASAA
ncbi:bacterioferritin-associated ferredoxin [Streptomyces sp. NPDC088354]|uniref:(2Fe-2S)-binding protein n=1 Tax=unclassified Streptomyces TaxID=2593676 RepID=UPI0029AECFCE|nr:(2Fe-2S)-binding protein [Streptomyces sp. MI02-7b]MDX3075212.1 (2Fe-2S)-binding protein [Streptomyces sp. MI02-7b]